ncbi:sperm flagellar protein 1-like [Topomyia yanbarensis]|uniref:sperm flagellar protein 1-like n=1 Tax=Topomyia yanbarensis TaxID=2498891 RepID=UPI00273BDB8A|nr:sperm flagellar protein 1-like [Topomyia yanbarensis]
MPASNILLTPEEKLSVTLWVNQFELSTSVKKLSRDLSDGVLVAEILHQLFPRMVDMHNYTRGFSNARKLDNWNTLNRKVLKKLDIYLSDPMIQSVSHEEPGTIEAILFEIMMKVYNY